MTYTIKQLNERITKGISNESTQTHDYLIVRAIQSQCFTPEEIANQVQLTGSYTTKDPLIKSVKWHLNKLVKEGVVAVEASTMTPVVKKQPKSNRSPKNVGDRNLETAAA